MKNVIITAIATIALTMGVMTAQAQNWALFGNYTDALVYQHYDNSVPPNPLGPNAGVNTWSSPTTTGFPDRINAYTSDTDTANYGGFRWLDVTSPYGNTGGGAANSYGGNLYFIRSDYSPIGSPDGYTRIGGLTPGVTYTVAAYSVVGNNQKDTVSFSLNGGTTWSATYNGDRINAALNGGGADWLLNSQVDAIGTAVPSRAAAGGGDTRYRVIIGDQVANAAGEVIVGFRDPNSQWINPNAVSDRGRIDGFAVAEGSVLVVPEPTTFALAGLGAAALLIFRRRS